MSATVTRPLPAPAPSAGGKAAASGPARRSRLLGAWPGAAGMALIAALTAANELWPAQAALLALMLTVPGLLLLRALRVPAPAIVGTPVYVPAASLVVLLASALAVDLVAPELGIEQPLRAWPLLVGLEGACALLLLAGAIGPRPAPGGWAALAIPAWRLWPLALPLASAAGAARLTNGDGAAVAIGTAAAVGCALAAGVLAAPRMSRSQLALLLYGTGLALAWSFSMRSGFVYGFDIAAEYQVAHGTGVAGVWEASHPGDAYGAMLSLTVLPALLHEVGGLSELAVLKAVYPALLALLPVAVFLVARRFLGARYAFAAGAFVVVQSYFFQYLPAIARQEIALLGFVMLVAVLVDEALPRGARAALAALLGLVVVVSHYSTTYLAVAVLGGAVVLQLLLGSLRRGPRASAALVAAAAAMLAGAALWYGPVTDSADNLRSFTESVRAQGLQILPNREDGDGIVEAYLHGNTTPSVSAARYEELAADDYAKNRPFVVPVPGADAPKYALRDAAAPLEPVRSEPADAALDGAELGVQQLANLLAILAALALAVRRRTPPALRLVALIGVSTLAVLAVVRLSGTAANAYNQERAFLQAMVPLAICLAWLVEAAARRVRAERVAPIAVVAALAAVLVGTSGLAGAAVGGGTPGNLATEGEDHERFAMVEPELAAARWLGAVRRPEEVLYADRYAQLRVLSQLGPGPGLLLDVTPRTLDQHAWVYAGAANAVAGRARGVSGGGAATYAFPRRFLADEYDLVYANGSAQVFHR